jgi:uncharacterized protein
MSFVIREGSQDPMPRLWLAGLLVALGVAAGGFFVGAGVVRGRAVDRYVEVKGLAEREVTADLALWPLRFTAGAEDLGMAQAQIGRATQQVLDFLARHSIEASSTELQNLQVNDATTNRYQQKVGPRFVIEQTVMVRSDKPQVVEAASQGVSELVSSGVVLVSSGEIGVGGPTYLFNGVNALKPAMIAEATANARKAAEQFARDSGAKLGGIRHANQGIFVILPRDQAPGAREGAQRQKIVRVVATVQYFLE